MSSGFTPINQVRLTNVAYVRLNKLGHRFEIACYRNKVVNWRNKIETDINEVLQIQNIFSNVSKGMLASKADLLEAFGTTNEQTICAEILEKGDVQVTELERQALIDGMFRDVATIVTEKSINTETERPYTITMIQNAMKDIHYSVSLTKNAKQQALDVIRKLRKVMPIARLMMSLRITLQLSLCNTMREFLLQKSATILKDTSSSNEENTTNQTNEQLVGLFEVSIDPEHYRSIQEYVDQITQGKGLLEILHQSTSSLTSTIVSNSLTTTTTTTTSSQINDNNDNNNDDNNDNDKKISSENNINTNDEQNTGSQKNVGSKKSKIKGKSSGVNDLPVELTSKLSLEDSLDEEHHYVDHEEVVIGLAKNKNKNKKKKSKAAIVEVEEDGNDEDADDQATETTSISTSNPNPSSTQSSSNNTNDNQPKKNKVGKKNKRLEKEKQKESEEREKEREIKLTKLQEVQEQKNQNNEKSTTESSSTSVSSSNINTTNNSTSGGAGGRCNTCQISFETPADYRAHYRSDWHRINLKRKMKKLPLAESEIEFQSHPIEYWDVDIVSSST